MKLKRDHKLTPYYTKVLKYANSKIVSHDVPGHKLGQIENEMMDYTGKNMFKLDANTARGLDNLSRPTAAIKEASELMADAFGAQKAYLLTGGTTLGILAMVMSVCRAEDKLILPRNVHKSVISALVLSGAVPIFVNPSIDNELGIANHMELNDIKDAVKDHPDAKAIFIINPTYFGVTSDLAEIVKFSHSKKMIVMVDEAHGSHFQFSEKLPISAMQAGADMSSCSLHKTVGSLTQSSILITQGDKIDHIRLMSTINLIQSTSPSSLLLSSLDVSRKKMYFQGKTKIEKLLKMTHKTRSEIDEIPGFKTMNKDRFLANNAFDYDETKIVIKVSDLGITGFDVYNELFDDYKVQVELAETHLILAVLSIATKQCDLDALLKSLRHISDKYSPLNLEVLKPKIKYRFPQTFTRPREAYHAPKKYIPLEQSVNEIAAESVMIYPPGIPLLIPGEIISQEILEDIAFYKRSGSMILSDTETGFIKVIDKKRWKKWEEKNKNTTKI